MIYQIYHHFRKKQIPLYLFWDLIQNGLFTQSPDQPGTCCEDRFCVSSKTPWVLGLNHLTRKADGGECLCGYNLSIYLSIHSSIHPSIHPPIYRSYISYLSYPFYLPYLSYLSIVFIYISYLSIYLIYLSILSIYLTYLSILLIYLSYLSIYLNYLSIYLSI